jgi:hypothetical protein|tara:strand:- start:95 stop:301 length:207 start_codon:yes stop_codon:yes gene_type:complete
MGESKAKYLRFRYTGTLDDLNAIKDDVEEMMREQGWKRGFSEMGPLDSNPAIYAWATGWKRFTNSEQD